MATLAQLVGDILPDDVRLDMADFLLRHGEKDNADFWKNLYQELENKLTCRILNEGGDLRVMGASLPRIKFTAEIFSDVLGMLQNEQGQATFSANWSQAEYAPGGAYLNKLISNASESDWRVELNLTRGNLWDKTQGKRVIKNYYTARIINSNGSHCIFDIPESLPDPDEPEAIHVLQFIQPVENQKGYFHMKREFKECVELFCFDIGYRGIFSPCLRSSVGSPPVRGQDDWRMENVGDGDWRLMRMWRRFGFIKTGLPERPAGEIFLMAPRFAPDCKKAIIESGLPNPFKELHRSIYGLDLESQLAA